MVLKKDENGSSLEIEEIKSNTNKNSLLELPRGSAKHKSAVSRPIKGLPKD